MEMAIGKSILSQIAFGHLRFFQRACSQIDEVSQLSWQEEEQRFFKAQKRAVQQLNDLYERALNQVGNGTATIFAIHTMLLQDADLTELVRTNLREKGSTAERAVLEVGRTFDAAFAAMDSPYMRARAADIRDIARRVIGLLMNERPCNPLEDGPAILVADTFLPSEVLELDHRRLLGLIARKGSVDSHTSVLLKAYGIPAMAEVELATEWDGHLALLDGFAHRLYLDPNRELLETLRQRYQAGGRPLKTMERELRVV